MNTPQARGEWSPPDESGPAEEPAVAAEDVSSGEKPQPSPEEPETGSPELRLEEDDPNEAGAGAGGSELR